MREYLQKFMEIFDYPKEAREALVRAYDAMQADADARAGFDALLDRYAADAGCACFDMLEEVRVLSEKSGVHSYTGDLLLLICMSESLREHYRREGIDEEIWKRSMYDLKWKLLECISVHGVWGSFVCKWLMGYFDLTRFAFGRMQFEIRPFKRYYEKNGVSLNPESRVINGHIPRSGERLDADIVAASYKEAAAFFKAREGLEQVVFVCDSWLLYPRNMEILSDSSNIRRFAGQYDIIESGEYEDYKEVWRLFDVAYTGDVEALPQNSSFRRGYADWIRKGIKTGWGYGVYVYEG